MAEIIAMPRLSDTMEEGTVVKWHKNVGDKIAEGDILADIETDKAIQEFESEFDGVLLFQGVAEGSTTNVDEILAIIGNEGEDISSLIGGGNSSKEEPKQEAKTEAVESKEEAAPAADIPDNVEVITMPRLSDTMEEGTVVVWHKNVGDKVAEGDILAEIETDKAVQEFESEFDGVLLFQGAKVNEPAPVDTILAIIGEEGTDVSGIVANGGKTSTASKSKPEETEDDEKPVVVELDVNNNSKSEETNGRIFASPLAKTIAKDKGINLAEVKGSGDNGRIIKKDIENYQPTQAKAETKTESKPAQTFVSGEDKVIPNSQMRKVIAKRLAESKFTAPHYYLNVELDMDNAIEARKQLNTVPNTKVSFNDIVVKAVAMALRQHPAVNSTWTDKEIIQHGDINIGVAVAVEDGLLVPVVKNTDQKSFNQISAEVRDYAGRARDRKLKADEMEKSTFSVSNLGMFGIESFTSIINQPNSCILSVGAIVQKPVVKDGQIVVGNTMKLSLACDHRTVDGATGAQFLQTLKMFIENPVTMLV
ncbi:pyruvate dehydrogenase E2 component (dihydrolipoamide acetyltransferase) [Chishuiella changwenlii]|jgi:pyruvate dehydrogenase E2 component (dihydrolipoamide acetyltransferase)|uniref:Dihydrolipoamide acetyltransferase component of pyruvate dehydrogenase complex n=1 Tax=Chishuiella changwenlii TaxID=1434701 RepID=A0A1M6TP90_9FLAO|nr:pyruvate dehydrogenase complex dihydrolipoamide acetyltransferase [Chishuiella changwenlii]GGF03854.1 dihydrolipoamide acetyltransferase component of pyruvate dehydrogenase complex [Chishuiella changwenlii]SHK58746.1 pyruvate dehydrogenase E2 component (dihydrolipoamide acetyltransferase) [Chishuiella changwenlii]